MLSFDIPQVLDVPKMLVQDITAQFLKDRCINKDTSVSPDGKQRRLILLLTGCLCDILTTEVSPAPPPCNSMENEGLKTLLVSSLSVTRSLDVVLYRNQTIL